MKKSKPTRITKENNKKEQTADKRFQQTFRWRRGWLAYGYSSADQLRLRGPAEGLRTWTCPADPRKSPRSTTAPGRQGETWGWKQEDQLRVPLTVAGSIRGCYDSFGLPSEACLHGHHNSILSSQPQVLIWLGFEGEGGKSKKGDKREP